MIKILKFPEVNNPPNATLKIADTKLYVSVVTLSTENDKKPLEQLKTRFKRTIKWNKYRSEVTNQTKNNSLNYLIDPPFTKVNLSFQIVSYHLKMKTIGHLFQSIMYQVFK